MKSSSFTTDRSHAEEPATHPPEVLSATLRMRAARSASISAQSSAVLQATLGGAPHDRQPGDDTAHVHAAAAEGTAGAGGPLPHFEAIQRSFGPHDARGIKAHVGGPAAKASAAIGARAYATGSDVAFAEPPDLHTAAHEAAHVVQQRGGVSLSGGVGQAGDPYERHADAVADRVVRGESAVDLLDQMSGRADAGAAQREGVQRRVVQRDDQDAEQDYDPTRDIDDAALDALLWPDFAATWRDTVTRALEARAALERLRSGIPEDHRDRVDAPVIDITYLDAALTGAIVNLMAMAPSAEQSSPAAEPSPQLQAGVSRVRSLFERFEAGTEHIEALAEGWGALLRMRVFEAFAALGQAQIDEARAIRTALIQVHTEIEQIGQRVGGRNPREVTANAAQARDMAEQQLAVDAALAVALTAISIVNPVIGAVLAIGGAGLSILLDGSVSGGDTPSAAGGAASVVQLRHAGRATSAIGRAAGRVNTAATIIGVTYDGYVLYEAASDVSRMRALGQQLQQLSRRYARLAPIINNLALAQSIVDGMNREIAVLRQGAQGGADRASSHAPPTVTHQDVTENGVPSEPR